MSIDLKDYAEQLLQETLAAAEVDGTPRLEAFTQLVIERLTAAGEFDDGQIAFFKKPGLEISGWSLDADNEVLHAFVTDWTGTTPSPSLTQTASSEALRRLAGFVSKCAEGYSSKLEESSAVWEVGDLIQRHVSSLNEVRLYLFSDGAARTLNLPKFDPIANVPVTAHVWDLERLYRLDTSGLERESITLDVTEFFDGPLPCLPGPSGSDHAVYLAVIPGRLLADLYGRFGSRLLERNVRSFLQARGAVNKEIRETILNRPDRFLAYNNGISATAADVSIVELPDGGIALAEIKDLQIVNGGQTTASIHHAATRDKADLSEVSVQAKLTVVRPDLIDEIVPSISRFSNTQNKVTGADFSANHQFHVRIEELSRSVWAPAIDGTQRQTHWFYERARGQYADELARSGTPAKQRQFKVTCPTAQKFTKTDLAKFLRTWEQRPNLVSLGGEKNFREFMTGVADRRIQPDVEWYHRLIATAILFRSAEKIVQRQNFGGYRAQIVTYTVAKLAHETQSRLDLDSIWRQQRLSPATEEAIAALSHPIHTVLTNPTGTVRHVGEWSKKLDCWKAVEEIPWDVPPSLATEIGGAEPTRRAARRPNEGLAGPTPTEQLLIEQIAAVDAEVWFGIAKWAKETDHLQGWQRSISFSLGRLASQGHNPSPKQAAQARILHEEAVRLGYPAEPLLDLPSQ